MKLYEISNEYRDLKEYLEENPEDTIEDISEIFANLEEEFEAKAENIAMVLSEYKSEADALKFEIDRLTARKKTCENAAERLKGYLEQEMIHTGKTKFKTAKFSFNVQNNPESVNILDESVIPHRYLIAQPPKIDKATIKSDLKLGMKIDGCELTQSQGLRIR